MRKTVFCFDLDDTLIANTAKYHAPIWRCGMLITKALGAKSAYLLAVLQLHGEIDTEMVKTLGYGTDRFPTSWVRTYEILAERAGVATDPSVVKRIRNTAARFRYGPYKPFEGVPRALAEIRRTKALMHLVTAGDEKLQWTKIRQSGLARFFDSIHVTGIDKKSVLAGIVGDRPHDGVMIGDSKKSDIKPAKELGMATVWVPSQTWSFANAEVEPDFTIASVCDLPSILDAIDKK